MKITVTEHGPFEVEGAVPLRRMTIVPNDRRESWEWRVDEELEASGSYRLCRCGGSGTKPFCDDSHLANGFDGTETASRAPYLEQAEGYEGPLVDMTDAEPLCAFSRFCDVAGGIWGMVESDDLEAADLVERQARRCVSGRLVAWRDGGAQEDDLPPSIGVVEDPGIGVSGPLFVRGRVTIVAADGTAYEVRNRIALCRCGASANKPFCDGSHASIEFKDESIHGA